MSSKYVSQGNTYNGDGTTKDDASSNGGVGAWNDIIAIMTAAPAYGTLSGGDIVNIRTADGSGDLTAVISGANKTMLARGDYDSFITWKFDDGTIWTESGTFIFSSTTAYRLTFSANNKWLGVNKNCKWYWDNNTSYTVWLALTRRNIFIDIEFEFGTTNGKVPYFYQGAQSVVYFVNCLFDMHALTSVNWFRIANYTNNNYFIGTYFDCNNIDGTGKLCMNGQGIGSKYFFYGGGFLNVNTLPPNLFKTILNGNYYSTNIVIEGFDFQGLDTDNLSHETSSAARFLTTYSNYEYSDAFDFYHCNVGGRIDWKKGQSYPTLNATLPEGTAWSLRCRNGDAATCHMTCPFTDNAIIIDSEAGDKKLTVELLIANTITSPTKRDFFLQISYFDANGNIRWESTREALSPAALASSTAAWSTTTYDGKNFTKYKIVHDLAYTIADDTPIEIVLGSSRTQVSADDWYFIDPDIIVEDA